MRRELIRAKQHQSIERLDEFILAEPDRYLPLSTSTVRLAAELWAMARQQGQQTASDAALDVDVLIAAQAQLLDGHVIVATDNVSHISRFVKADEWENIRA